MTASTVPTKALAAPPRLKLLLAMLATAAGYYLGARLGLLIPYVGSHVSLVWVPTGIAMAAYLRWGGGMSLAVVAAAFAVNLGVGGPVWMNLGVALGNALGPWLSVLLLRRWRFDETLVRRRDLFVYLSAVLLGMLLTASNGTCWLRLAGVLGAVQWGYAWTSWWIGDSVGALLGGVPLITASTLTLAQAFGGRRGVLNMGVVALVLLCGAFGFSPWSEMPGALMFPLLALPLFLIALLAMRAGVLAASLAVLLLSMEAAWGTANGIGPFAGQDAQMGLLALWSYLTAQACTTVLICGLSAELLSVQRQQTALFRHAEDGILVIGPDGVLSALNPAARLMLDLGVGEGERGCGLAALPHGHGQALQGWLAALPGQGATQPRQYLRLRRADGGSLELEVQATRFLDAHGAIMTQLILRDVTERWRAEALLAASERRLRDLTDNVPALLSEFDGELRFRFANRIYRDWLGLDPARMLGKSIAEVMGPRVHEEVLPSAQRALRGEAVSYEREAATTSGQRWIRVTMAPRWRAGAAGEPPGVEGFYTVASDVTDFKRAEEALRQSEQRLRSIADHLPMHISFVDCEGRYRFMNQAYELSLGRPRESFYGQTVKDVIGPAAFSEVGPRIARVLAGETQIFDSERTTREGYRCYRSTFVPQYAEGGKTVLGFVCMVVDTTMQKLEERRLTELAQVDMLTGLLNRAGFEQRCAEALQRSRSRRRLMALMFLDLDGFKQVNDSLGHLSGDLLLRGFAGRLTRTLRGDDTLARLGGDEFVVITEGLAHDKDAATVASNIVEAMREPFILETHPVRVTVSAGVALYDGGHELSPKALLQRADELLYQAKAQGRDRLCLGRAQA